MKIFPAHFSAKSPGAYKWLWEPLTKQRNGLPLHESQKKPTSSSASHENTLKRKENGKYRAQQGTG